MEGSPPGAEIHVVPRREMTRGIILVRRRRSPGDAVPRMTEGAPQNRHKRPSGEAAGHKGLDHP